jgi:non-canonical poly(A) RNA polymerase PAPD5/7
MSTWHMKVRLIWVPDYDTRITRNNFGFCKLLPEIPERNDTGTVWCFNSFCLLLWWYCYSGIFRHKKTLNKSPFFQVKSAFSKAYSVLTDANLFISLGHNRSILGTIVRPDSVLLDRKGWNNEDMLAEPWEPITQQFDTENDAVYNWHVIDEDEPLPRNSQSTSEDTSSSPSKKRKSPKSRRKSRKKSKATASGSSDVANGFRKDRSSSKREAGSSKRRKAPKEYDRFTNTLPKYTHVSKW